MDPNPPGGIPKMKGLDLPVAKGKYEVTCAIPIGWETAFVRRRGKTIVISAHPDHTPRWSPLSKRMRPFDQWPKLHIKRRSAGGKEK